MGFGQFLAAPEVKMTIVTYRDIFQNSALEVSRFDEKYEELSAIIKLDPKDISKLAIKEGETVIVKSGAEKIVVKAQVSGYEETHEGVAYMVNSPWSNALISDATDGTGVPNFKNFQVMVQSAKGEKVTGIKDIF